MRDALGKPSTPIVALVTSLALLISVGLMQTGSASSATARARARPARPAQFVGAHALNWRSADSVIGPMRSDKIFYPPSEPLPPRWPRDSYGLARGALAIVAYKVPTENVLSFVRSIPRNRPVTMVFWQEPEAHLRASQFRAEFEQQSRLIHSARRPNVKVAFDASIWRYQPQYRASYDCQFVPKRQYVDYYYGDVYEPNDQTLRGERQFQRWTHCTAHRGRRRGLAEYGLGDCQGNAYRARTIMSDASYLSRNYPYLQVLSYWWNDTSHNSGTSCHNDWQFTDHPGVSAWRALESAQRPPRPAHPTGSPGG